MNKLPGSDLLKKIPDIYLLSPLQIIMQKCTRIKAPNCVWLHFYDRVQLPTHAGISVITRRVFHVFVKIYVSVRLARRLHVNISSVGNAIFRH